MNESQIFAEALKCATPSERSGYLDQACAGRPQLRADVEALLRAEQGDPDFLEQPAEPFEKTVAHSQAPAGPSAADEPLPDLEGPGSVLGGRYKLYEQIGEGGMGTVWMALQSVPVRRQVAVKLIKAGMDSRQVIARFEAERQALALMDHPSIAKVLDAGATPAGRPYFVMELVKGIPLTKYCDENRLPLRERLELFIPVCQAIQHAHQKGIIHRDIKPSNVLVCLYDGRPVPKVIDFGVAKATGQQLTEQTLVTGFGAVVGTLEYMSPEQAEVNQLDIDTRSDIYSLGVLLYELLTGTTPLDRKRFKQAAMFELLRLIREVDPPRPSTRLSESRDTLPAISAQRKSEPARLTTLVRGELDWIVMKALEKDRNRRYETANSFLQDVQRYLVDEPVQACPPSTAYRFRKFVRRNRAGLTAGTLVALALVVGMLVSFWQAVRATKAEGVAQEERSKAERLAKTEAEAHKLAVEQSRLANERAEDLARRLYIHRVNLGYREALANNVAQADALLDACEPARRGWEWAFSKRLCHLEKMTLGGFADHAATVASARRGPSAPETSNPEVGKAVSSVMGAVGNVRGMAYSPDGRQIAAAHDDGTVGIYDSRTGRGIRSLRGHEGCASCVTFDADGGRVISGGFDRTIRVWDAKTGEQKLILRGHTRPVLSIAFRPGTEELATSAHGAWEAFFEKGFEIKQWDLAEGREIRTLHHGHGWAHTEVAFSPDGRRLLSTSVWGGFLRLWDADTGKELEERPIPENSRGLAVSSADGRVAYGGADNLLWVSSPDLGTAMEKYSGHAAPILGVAFSPDGSRVASASADGTIRVWNVADGREQRLLRGHTAGVNSVAFHRDGDSLVSAGEDGRIKSWDRPLAPDPFPISYGVWAHQARFSPDGQRAAVVRFSAATVMDSTTAQTICDVALPGGDGQLTYSRDARLIATRTYGSDRGEVWDAQSGRPVATCPETTGHLCGVCFGSGTILALAADDGSIQLWDVATGRTESVIQTVAGGARGMTFDPSGSTLATIGADCAVRLWDVATGQPVRQLGVAAGQLAPFATDSLAFDPEGRHLAATRGDGTVVIWDVTINTEVFTLRGHTRAINAVAWSPDGRRIATASDDFTIKLWDAANGDEVFTLRGHTGFVIGLGFSPDGNRLLSASADGTVRSWDATPRSN